MKRLLALALALAGWTVGFAAPKAFSLEQPFAATVPLQSWGTQRVAVRFAANATHLEVRVRNHVQRLELTTLDDTMKGAVLVGDFNFDGWADIAVPDGIGYGGVNYFYVLYAFQPSQSRFVRLEFPGEAGLCNPVLRTATRTIETDCKSGPKYNFTDYRFARGKPYIYHSAEMVVLNGFDSDQYLIYSVSTFNLNGSRLSSSISDEPRRQVAPLRYLPIPKAPLYSAPRASAITANSIVRGDAIRILNVIDGADGQWLKIAYQSRKLGRIVRWILL
jgi:hypothetical protein